MGAHESTSRSREPPFEIGAKQFDGSGIYKVWENVNDCQKYRQYKGLVFSTTSMENATYFETGIKFLKQLRHPGVLVFLEKPISPGKIALVTEKVQVLDMCIGSMTFTEVQSGLFQILQTLVFLHEKAKICHNNISPWSIFVTKHGEWRLGGFEMAQHLETANNKFLTSPFYNKIKCIRFMPPSDRKLEPGTKRDIYAFGRLIDYALSHFSGDELLNDEITESLRAVSARMTNIEIEQDVSSQLHTYAFSNDLISISDFLSTIQIKSQAEKEEFYQSIEERLRGLPVEVVARRLSRLVMARFVLVEPLSHKYLYPNLLTPKAETSHGIIPEDLFITHMIPEIVRVFAVKEVSVRLGLLSHFSGYAKFIPKNVLQGFVLEEISRGYRDVNDQLVAASLRALADAVDILGAAGTVEWDLTKSFANGSSKTTKTSNSSGEEKKEKIVKEPSKELYLHTSEYKQGYIRASPKEKLKVEEPEEEIHNSWDEEDDWGDNWNVQEPQPQYAPETPTDEKEVSPKETEKTSTALKLNGFKNRDQEKNVKPLSANEPTKPIEKKKKANNIGAFYEIKPLPAEEEDIFAGMAPKIKIGQNLLDKLAEIQEKEKEEKKKQLLAQSSKFAMTVEANIGVGWDDEGDVFEDPEDPAEERPATTAKQLFSNLQ